MRGNVWTRPRKSVANSRGIDRRRVQDPFLRSLRVELLECRALLASNFGDTPPPSAAVLPEGGAAHAAPASRLFGLQNVISTAATRASAVSAADVDGDGDTDVLAASPSESRVVWYDNDGTPADGDRWRLETLDDHRGRRPGEWRVCGGR